MDTVFASFLNPHYERGRKFAGLQYAPNTLLPQLLSENNSPHSIPSSGRRLLSWLLHGRCRSDFALVTHYFAIHPTLYHAEHHSLNGSVQLVVRRLLVGCTDVGQNCLAYGLSQVWRRCSRKQRK